VQKAGVTAFFHFDKKRPYTCSSKAALSSILAQVMKAHCRSKEFIDIASLVMSDTGSGQIMASINELCSTLHVFLAQMTASYLIFDGLDECTDPEGLLLLIEGVIAATKCKVALLSRPEVRLSNLEEDVFNISLGAFGNTADIEYYLQPQVRRLVDRRAIAGNLSAMEIASQLATRANSMFLWAVLMISYLSTPILTPEERFTAIQELNSFEGLDAMYSKILQGIYYRTPKKHSGKIKQVLQWLVVAQHPWNLDMLHIALAVQLNRPAVAADFIPDFKRSLIEIFGSLLEVHENNTVSFIHLSVLEFLVTPAIELHEAGLKNPFPVQKEIAHCSAARLCLSYLLNDIRHQPLSGDASTTPCQTMVNQRLPLLNYATVCWSEHAFQGLNLLDMTKQVQICESLFPILSNFISNRQLVTLWIEALWLYRSPLDLSNLASAIEGSPSTIGFKSRNEGRAFKTKFRDFANVLLKLAGDWGQILLISPNEIWLPSIQAFTDSKFWEDKQSAKLTFLDCDKDIGSILIASQLSSNGKEIAVIKVWPPE
jgi:hypothetical protein